MAKRKDKRTSDWIDIKDLLDGPIGKVIERLQELQATYPKGEIEVRTDYEYGEGYAAARLNFERDKTPLELECEQWDAKARQYQALKTESFAFANNKTPYPRADEMEALRKELGFFAMVPMRGTLRIYENEVIVMDMTRGGRRRDGTWVFQMMSPMMMAGGAELSESAKALQAMYDRMDEECLT